MKPRLAFMTIGLLHEPMGSPRVQEFFDRVPEVYDATDRSDGFGARSIRNVQTWRQSWGPLVAPKCYPTLDCEERLALTLSYWQDLESVAAFAYHGAHGDAMTKRREWFQSLGLPGYVAWWDAGEGPVSAQEAADRLDHLHEHGSTAHAFNFGRPFDAEGNAVTLDRERIMAKVALNAGP